VLSGFRVLDLTDERGWLSGKILGDLGADVIKVEPPGGDPGRRRGPFLPGSQDPEASLRWLALNTSKRSVELDLAQDADRERFFALTASADGPELVYCAITPFGQTGPWASYRGHDLVVVALGGNLACTGDPDRAPLRCSMPTAYYHAAPEAALGVAMALWARRRGLGGQLVDVSLHECQLQTLLSLPGQYALHGRPAQRGGARTGRTREIWPARDGYVTFGLRGGPARLPNLIATVEYMAECGMAPDWLREYDWQAYDPAALEETELERLEQAFADFFESRSMRELYDQALARRILLAPCNDARAILEHGQLRDRELFVTLDYPEFGAALEHPDFFARTFDRSVRIRGRAPRIGEHQEEVFSELAPRVPGPTPDPPRSGGLFRGLKILELGSGAAGPVAARYFAEQGADVLRVESAQRPDFLRLLSASPGDRSGLDRAPMFLLLNPNKRSIAVNLKHPRGVALVKRLAAWADVVAENFSPGVMDRWGLGWDALHEANPDLIMLGGCLFGHTGPQRDYPGFGGQGSAICGFNHLTGWPDREALGPYATITDSLSPRYVALALVAALLERERTGRGRYIDLSQIETGVYSLSEWIVRESALADGFGRCGNDDEAGAPHGVYPCAGDDRWLAIAVWSDEEWQRLREVLGDPPWARDPRFASAAGRREHREEIDAGIAQWTRAGAPHEHMAKLQAAGVEAGAVQRHEDLLLDPQLAHRGHFVRMPHAQLGELSFEHSALVFSASPRLLDAPGPNLGEHTDLVLEELLGLGADERASLRADGVLS
jgi:crotonobetainyl-CoA:carnitine CoA-transferase CaiB-like acyl-CoA transferase